MRVGTYLLYNKNSQPSNCLRCDVPEGKYRTIY